MPLLPGNGARLTLARSAAHRFTEGERGGGGREKKYIFTSLLKQTNYTERTLHSHWQLLTGDLEHCGTVSDCQQLMLTVIINSVAGVENNKS